MATKYPKYQHILNILAEMQAHSSNKIIKMFFMILSELQIICITLEIFYDIEDSNRNLHTGEANPRITDNYNQLGNTLYIVTKYINFRMFKTKLSHITLDDIYDSQIYYILILLSMNYLISIIMSIIFVIITMNNEKSLIRLYALKYLELCQMWHKKIMFFYIHSWMVYYIYDAIINHQKPMNIIFESCIIFSIIINFILAIVFAKFMTNTLRYSDNTGFRSNADLILMIIIKFIVVFIPYAGDPTMMSYLLQCLIFITIIIRLALIHNHAPFYSWELLRLIFISTALIGSITLAKMSTIITQLIYLSEANLSTFTLVLLVISPFVMLTSLRIYEKIYHYSVRILPPTTENNYILRLGYWVPILKTGYKSDFDERDINESEILLYGKITGHFQDCHQCNKKYIIDKFLSDPNDHMKKTFGNIQSHIVENLLERGCKKFPQSAHILLCFVWLLLEKRDNLNKVFMLFERLKNNVSTYEDRLNMAIIEYKIKQYNNQLLNECPINFQLIEICETFYQKFINHLRSQSQLHMKFWNSILNDTMILADKIIHMSNNIHHEYLRTKRMWIEYEEKYMKSFYKPLIAYSTFLTLVKNQQISAEIFLNKYENLVNLFKRNDHELSLTPKNILSLKNILIIISGQKENLGEIISCSQSIEDMLGYSHLDLLTKDIAYILPNYYKQYHNGFLEKFHETGKGNMVNTTKIKYFKNSKGYIVPGYIHVKILYQPHDKISFAGIIRPIEKYPDCIILIQNGFIDGITPKLAEILKIKVEKGKNLHIIDICEDLLALSVINDKTKNGDYTPNEDHMLNEEQKQNYRPKLSTISNLQNICNFESFQEFEGNLILKDKTHSSKTRMNGINQDQVLHNSFSLYSDKQKKQIKSGDLKINLCLETTKNFCPYVFNIKDSKPIEKIKFNVKISKEALINFDALYYLEFADKGKLNIQKNNTESIGACQSPFKNKCLDEENLCQRYSAISGDEFLTEKERTSNCSFDLGDINAKNNALDSNIHSSLKFKKLVISPVKSSLLKKKKVDLNHLGYEFATDEIRKSQSQKYFLDSKNQFLDSKNFKVYERPLSIKLIESPTLKPTKTESKIKINTAKQNDPARMRESIAPVLNNLDQNDDKNLSLTKNLRIAKRKIREDGSVQSRKVTKIHVLKKLEESLENFTYNQALNAKLLAIFGLLCSSIIGLILIYLADTNTLSQVKYDLSIINAANNRLINYVDLTKKIRILYCIKLGLISLDDLEKFRIENLPYYSEDSIEEVFQKLNKYNIELQEMISMINIDYQKKFNGDNILIQDTINNTNGIMLSNNVTYLETTTFIAIRVIYNKGKDLVKLTNELNNIINNMNNLNINVNTNVNGNINYNKDIDAVISIYDNEIISLALYLIKNDLNDIFISLTNIFDIINYEILLSLNYSFNMVFILMIVNILCILIMTIFLIYNAFDIYKQNIKILVNLFKIKSDLIGKEIKKIQYFISMSYRDKYKNNTNNNNNNSLNISLHSPVNLRVKKIGKHTELKNEQSKRTTNKSINTFKIKLKLLKNSLLFLLIIIIISSIFYIKIELSYLVQESFNTNSKRLLYTIQYNCNINLAATSILEYLIFNGTTNIENQPSNIKLDTLIQDIGKFQEFLIYFNDNNEEIFENILNGDLCYLNTVSESQNDCNTLGGGIIKKGLSNLNAYTYTVLRSIKNKFDISNRSKDDIINVLNMTDFHVLNSVIARGLLPGYSQLFIAMNEAFINKINGYIKDIAIWLTIAFIVIVLIIVLIWYPVQKYLKHENYKIKKLISIFPKSHIISDRIILKYVFHYSQDMLNTLRIYFES